MWPREAKLPASIAERKDIRSVKVGNLREIAQTEVIDAIEGVLRTIAESIETIAETEGIGMDARRAITGRRTRPSMPLLLTRGNFPQSISKWKEQLLERIVWKLSSILELK